MNLKNIGLVISHEYSVRVRKKSFIITTIITPLIFGLMIALPVLIALWGGGESHKVKVIDPSGEVMQYLESGDNIQYEAASDGETAALLLPIFEDTGLYAIIDITEFDAEGNLAVTAYSKEPLNIEVKHGVKDAVDKAAENHKLAAYNISGINEIMESVKSDIQINTLTLSEDGTTKEDRVEIYMALSYIMSFLIYLFVFLFGNMVMRSVIDEKSSRVVEVLVSSLNSIDLMMGKIIGVALVALTQFALWVVLTIAIAGGVSAAATPGLAGTADAVQIGQMAQAPNVNPEAVEALGVLDNIRGLNWEMIIGSFVLYFLLGYLLYASMFAAIGAACDNETDTGQLQMPVTIPLIIGLFIMLHTFEHPSSGLSFWASMIPFTSPMVMLARIPFGVVPAWELILSISLLLLTFIGTAYLSAKIYKIGILMYGKKTSFKDLWKWIKQKE